MIVSMETIMTAARTLTLGVCELLPQRISLSVFIYVCACVRVCVRAREHNKQTH